MARQKVSERTFIDADGNEVDRMEQATGARYTLVQIGKSFDVQLGAAGEPSTMFGVFGFWTKVGNVANTVLNDKDEPGDAAQAAAEIEEFLASVESGVWREVSEGAKRGPKYDNAILAAVLHAFFESKGVAKGGVDYYIAKLTEDKKYRATMVARNDVRQLYSEELERRGVARKESDLTELA